MSDRFYVTTPIYYVNAEPHLGHAYTTIVADVLARFHRLAGSETFFLTGTDEHGDKIMQAAEGEGVDPKEFADRISSIFKATWPRLLIEHDYFIRTTDEAHKKVVSGILQSVYDAGDIYFDKYAGLYCVGCERFYTDKELEGGLCPQHLKAPEERTEENYFFRMSKYQDWLKGYILDNPDFIRPERYKNEVLAMLAEPLDDLCISRPVSRLSWGIPLPFDENYVTYVWFDALINYISALGYPEGEKFNAFWPHANHIIAKDILKPHAIFWPTMLKAAGIPLYQHLHVHGYWIIGDMKMSKSLGTLVKPLDLADIYGVDPFRYFLMREMSFGLDASFNEDALVGRYNADLANNLGNLVSRVLAMAVKYFDGRVPAAGGEPEEIDRELTAALESTVETFERDMTDLAFHKGLIALWEYLDSVNRYVAETEPFNLAKDPAGRGRLSRVIYTLLDALKSIAVMISPVMPETAGNVLSALGIDRPVDDLRLAEDAGPGRLEPGSALKRPAALFPRVDVKKEEGPGVSNEQKPERDAEAQPVPATEPGVSFEEFARVRLKVGVIRSAEKIKGSKKLLKLMVDVGEPRQIVAGIAQDYDPEELVGKRVVVAANLKPAKIMGVESFGMVLAASGKRGFTLITTDEDAEPGSGVS